MPPPRTLRLALPLIAFVAAQSAVAQGPERRGFIGLGIGPSTPVGTFADRSRSDMESGRALPGYTSTLLNLGYRFGESFGVAAVFAYSQYDIREGGDDDWWEVAEASIGPMYSRALSAKAALDLKAMFGLIAMTPVVDGYSTGHGTGSGLGVDLRATLRYDLLRQWALFAEGGFQTSGVSFDSGARTNYRAVISGLGLAYRPAW